MTVGLAAAQANAMLDTVDAGNVYVKLHTGDPGAAGVSNASAETTRQQITFEAAGNTTDGEKNATNQPSWASWSAGTESITHVSLWDNLTAGNFLWSVDVGDKTVNDDDDLTLTSLVLTASPLAA